MTRITDVDELQEGKYYLTAVVQKEGFQSLEYITSATMSRISYLVWNTDSYVGLQTESVYYIKDWLNHGEVYEVDEEKAKFFINLWGLPLEPTCG